MTMASQAFLSTAAPHRSRASCSGVGPPARARLALLNVQMMVRDVLLDRRGHLACDGSTPLDVLTDPARRHVGRALEAQDHAAWVEAGSLEIRGSWRLAAGTRHHHDRRQPSDLFGLVPALEQL